MEPNDLRRRWEEAHHQEQDPPDRSGLIGLPAVSDPAALTGAALAVLGLSLANDANEPARVRRASRRYYGWAPRSASGLRAVDYGDVEVVKDDPAVAFMQAHERLADIVAAGAAPLVLGGDGLTSVPVLQVLSGKLRGRLGIVAFTPAYEIAPDPLYASVSRWARALELGIVSPANVALIGGRAAPPDEPARRVLDDLGAALFSLDDVTVHGMATVAQESLETAAAGTEAVYLSVDVAVLAGIGDPVGLQARELVAGVAAVSGALLAAADVCVTSPLKSSLAWLAVSRRTPEEPLRATTMSQPFAEARPRACGGGGEALADDEGASLRVRGRYSDHNGPSRVRRCDALCNARSAHRALRS